MVGKLGSPTPLHDAAMVAYGVAGEIEGALGHLGVDRVLVAGSVRRNKPLVQDVDLVIVTDGVSDLTIYEDELPEYHWTPKGGVINRDDVRVELYLAPAGCEGATLQFCTGPGELNVYLRMKAKRLGWKLSQYGLLDPEGVRHDRSTGDPYADEQSIFEALDVPYMEPDQRTHWREFL